MQHRTTARIFRLRKRRRGMMLRANMKRSHSVAAATLIATSIAAFIACGPNQDNLPPPPPPPAPPPSSLAQAPVTDMGVPDASTAPSTPKAEEKPVTLVVGPKGEEPPKPTPIVKISAPTKDQVIPADKVNLDSVSLK